MRSKMKTRANNLRMTAHCIGLRNLTGQRCDPGARAVRASLLYVWGRHVVLTGLGFESPHQYYRYSFLQQFSLAF